MREIKFRAWIKEEDIMTYFEDESYILNGDMSVDAFDYEKSDCKNYFEPCYKTVDAELMQFTGLHDKNGKEIYEGDIIQHWYDYSDITDRYLVEYDEDELSYVFQNLSNRNNFIALEDLYDEDYGDYSIEVIGNIYENSKFLKGADNIE